MDMFYNIKSDLNILNSIYDNCEGTIKFHVENAIKSLNCIVEQDNNISCAYKVDIFNIYNELKLIIDNLQYYNSKNPNHYLISAWWNLSLAICELEFNNPILLENNNIKLKTRV